MKNKGNRVLKIVVKRVLSYLIAYGFFVFVKWLFPSLWIETLFILLIASDWYDSVFKEKGQ